jgi:cell division septal protein FtsQ
MGSAGLEATRVTSTLRPARRGLPPAPHIDLPLHAAPEEPAFFRPKSRTRVRRSRRGLSGRAVLALEALGAVLALLVTLWAGYSKVMASEKLRVGRVDVRGSRFLSEGEVRELLGPAVGENILGLDIESLKQRLRASPWVADAAVRRTLPDTLQVQIRERVPLALAELDRLYLMDGDGTLIDIYGPRTSGFDLPIVRGLKGIDDEARADRARRAGALLADLSELAAEVSEVQVEPSGDLRVVLRGAGEVLKLGTPPCKKRFLTFLGLRKDLRDRCPGAEYFDLRFRGRIYAKNSPAQPVPAPPPAPAVTASRPETPRPEARPAAPDAALPGGGAP